MGTGREDIEKRESASFLGRTEGRGKAPEQERGGFFGGRRLRLKIDGNGEQARPSQRIRRGFCQRLHPRRGEKGRELDCIVIIVFKFNNRTKPLTFGCPLVSP